ncbi:uncharacterized protein LOC135815710 isoform X2 [Sycon ciliatum]|uniref:uncharacterized protein LOC135815710 isoform X2 n=1 Tax=Sycon ciliatum TaxID=27933 RepID=UPI0031F7110C
MPRGYLNRSSSKLTKADISQPVTPSGKTQEKERASKGLGLLRNFDWSKQWESAYRTLPGTPWRHKRKKASNPRRRLSYDQRQSLASIHSLGKGCESKVFGIPLAQLVLEANAQVPYLVSDIVTFLSSYGLKEEGLFRVSGNVRIIEKIRAALETRGCPIDFSPYQDDMAAVASILKMFLRELPEAVIPTSVHAMFIRAQADNEQNVEQCVWELRELVNAIPDAERDLLVYLCGFLRTVADHVDTTKMTAKALGIVFGPNLFRCSGGLEGLKEQTYTNHIVEKFIMYHGDIFTELNLSSVPTSSCDSLDEPRPASADSVLLAERSCLADSSSRRLQQQQQQQQRLSRTSDIWHGETAASRRQSVHRQASQHSTMSNSRPPAMEYHVNHPNLCGVNSNSSCASYYDKLSPLPYNYQPGSSVSSTAGSNREAASIGPIDIDVSPWRSARTGPQRYSAVLPGRVRNAVDRWETAVQSTTTAGALDDTDASISADDLYDSTPSRSAGFSRNLSRRPRVAIPSVFLEDTKRRLDDHHQQQQQQQQESQRSFKQERETSSPGYSSTGSSLLDDIIRLLESGTPVKTSGETTGAYRPGRDRDSPPRSASETPDSVGYRNLDMFTRSSREGSRRQKAPPANKQYAGASSDDSFHYQLSNPADEITLTAGAHVQRARSLRSDARAARKQFSPLVHNEQKVVPRLPRRSPHSFSVGSPARSTPSRSRRSRSGSSSRSDDADRRTDDRPKSAEKRAGLRRGSARAASFRYPPVVARRLPRVSSIERRKVQSLPPLELADDGDSESCRDSEETGRYLGHKRKRRQDTQDEVRLDADLLQLLRELQYNRQVASSSGRHSNRDSGAANEEPGAKVAFSSRNSTPRSSGSRQHSAYGQRSASDAYSDYHPSMSSKKGRWSSASAKAHGNQYDPRRPRPSCTPTNTQEEQICKVVNYITSKLAMKRTLANRPSEFKDMTGDQLLSEKKNIQKCLLQYEAQFGRPSSEAERQLMRPLYEQYRVVKKYLQLANSVQQQHYRDSPHRESVSTTASSRQSSDVFSSVDATPRHSRQSRPSQTYVENFMAGGMVQPAPQSPSNMTVSSFGSIHSPAMSTPPPSAMHQMQFMRGSSAGGGMVPAPAGLSMPAAMNLNQAPMSAHPATVVQSPLWWTTSLQRATRAELLDLQLQVLLEKGQLRKLLKTFEEEFHRHTGRKITKHDRGRMTAEYDRYKYCKAQLKLLDALLSKPIPDNQQAPL